MIRDVCKAKGMSDRQCEVVELAVKGLSNREIAHQLFVTERTIKNHLTNIYKLVGVGSRAQMIVFFLPHLNFISSNNNQGQARNDISG